MLDQKTSHFLEYAFTAGNQRSERRMIALRAGPGSFQQRKTCLTGDLAASRPTT